MDDEAHVPAIHEVHVLPPVATPVVDPGVLHVKQKLPDEAPVTDEYDPAKQLVHTVTSVFVEYFPAGHAKHALPVK